MKAGEFVEFTDADMICGPKTLTNRKKYEVIREDEPGFFILDDNGEEYYIAGYERAYYERAEAPVAAIAGGGFEVGDRVSVLRCGYILDDNQLTGTIVAGRGYGGRADVKLDNYTGGNLGFPLESITLIAAPSRTLKVGDIVRIDREETQAAGSVNEPGDIGEVTCLYHAPTSTKVQVSGRPTYSNYELTKYLTLVVAVENREDK
jgi:hypothetical protein